MKIRFGIVGCGFLGNIVANAWKDGFLEDYEHCRRDQPLTGIAR